MTQSTHHLCQKCNEAVPDDSAACPKCGTAQELTPLGALQGLLHHIKLFVKTEERLAPNLRDAMRLADEVIASLPQTYQTIPTATIEAMLASIHPDLPALTCKELLGHARDAADSLDALLQAANKTCGGLATLLLLDMIQDAHRMAFRVREIINATGEGSNGKEAR